MAKYQVFMAPIFDTVGHFQSYSQFFGAGFTTIGWVNLSGVGTVNTSGTAVTWASGNAFCTEWVGSQIAINGTNYTILSVNSTTSITLTATAGTQTGVTYYAGFGTLAATGTGASYAFTNPVLPTLTINQAPQAAYTFRGAWVSGQAYPNGALSANGTADIVMDTSNGVAYQKITTNVATNLATAPHSNATDWAPFQYEIWKSTGANSSTLPLYVRLAYCSNSTTNASRAHIAIGTGVDLNGNLTGGAILNTTLPFTNSPIDTNQASGTSFENDFSGDADNFRFILQRGNTVSSTFNTCIVADRSKTASGTDTNAFVYVGYLISRAASGLGGNSIICNSSIGNVAVGSAALGWCGAQTAGSYIGALTFNGGTPPFFVYPMVGYQAPPLLGCVGFHRDDVLDGSVMYVWNYGVAHAYLVNSLSTSANQALDNVGSHGIMPAILWE